MQIFERNFGKRIAISVTICYNRDYMVGEDALRACHRGINQEIRQKKRQKNGRLPRSQCADTRRSNRKSAAGGGVGIGGGQMPVLFQEYFKGVFMRNEQKRTDSAERHFQVI